MQMCPVSEEQRLAVLRSTPSSLLSGQAHVKNKKLHLVTVNLCTGTLVCIVHTFKNVLFLQHGSGSSIISRNGTQLCQHGEECLPDVGHAEVREPGGVVRTPGTRVQPMVHLDIQWTILHQRYTVLSFLTGGAVRTPGTQYYSYPVHDTPRQYINRMCTWSYHPQLEEWCGHRVLMSIVLGTPRHYCNRVYMVLSSSTGGEVYGHQVLVSFRSTVHLENIADTHSNNLNGKHLTLPQTTPQSMISISPDHRRPRSRW